MSKLQQPAKGRFRSFLLASLNHFLAARLGMTEGALKVAVHRLRQRYRQILRDQIAGTVAESKEIDEELRHLLAALSGE